MSYQELLKKIKEQGFTLTMGGSGHWKVHRDGQYLGVLSATPCRGTRSWNNTVSLLRRWGVNIPRK